MNRMDSAYRSVAAFAAVGLALTSIGCSHVGTDDFETEIAHVREEMQAGDQQTAAQLNNRIDGVEDRVTANEASLEGLERDLRALEREFDVAVERLETALRFSTPVYFGFDSSDLRTEDHEVLERFCSVLQSYYPGSLVTVEGFTDQSGAEDYNLRLGQARATSVSEYLVAEGCISGDQIRAVSYGEDTERLVAAGVTGPGEEGWENRRVVIVIDHGGNGPNARAVVSD